MSVIAQDIAARTSPGVGGARWRRPNWRHVFCPRQRVPLHLMPREVVLMAW